jgi:dephospho-CoA kinase
MLKVGLTGSIAVGKSYVCSVFRELGCDVLDADQTAREVVRAGTEGLRQIVSYFGDEVLQENGELNRAKLGAIVFANREKREKLNSIVHPLVFQAQDHWLKNREAENPDGIAIVDAALMIESRGYKRFNKLIVVWCEPTVQLERLMAREAITQAEAMRRIDAQMPQEEKKKYADYLIDTSNGYEDTRRQVTEIFERLSVLSKEISVK